MAFKFRKNGGDKPMPDSYESMGLLFHKYAKIVREMFDSSKPIKFSKRDALFILFLSQISLQLASHRTAMEKIAYEFRSARSDSQFVTAAVLRDMEKTLLRLVVLAEKKLDG